MKWLADENISKSAIAFLRSHGEEVLSVAELAPGILDEQVMQMAVAQQCILLSFDRDHGDLIFGQGIGPPPAVVYLRLYPQTPESMQRILAGLVALGEGSLNGQFTVVQTEGIRQRALPLHG